VVAVDFLQPAYRYYISVVTLKTSLPVSVRTVTAGENKTAPQLNLIPPAYFKKFPF
jgi:hypothetical protein